MSSTRSRERSTLSPPPSRPSLLRALSSSSALTKSSLSPISKKDKPRLYLGLFLRGASHTSSSSNTVFNSSLTCPAYHWSLLVSPKTSSRHDPGTCYHILHSSDRSYYEETDLSRLTSSQSATLLVRITLAKVLDEDKVRSIIRSLSVSSPPSSSSISCAPIPSNHPSHLPHHSKPTTPDPQTDPTNINDCLAWTRTTFLTLFSPTNATNTTPSTKPLKTYLTTDDWAELEETARKYAKKKRNLGRFHSLGIGLNRGPPPPAGAGAGAADAQPAGWLEWDDDEIATWNFWERRETTQ